MAQDKDQEPILFEAPEDMLVPPEGRATLTVAQQAQRNMEIVSARMRGLGWAQIANTYGLKTRRCKQIMQEYRESNPTLRHHDPVDIVDQMLDGYQGAVEELALISATTTHDAVRVGAINSRMHAIRSMGELLQAIGVLPNDLGTLRVELDARVTAERLVAVIEHFNLPDEIADAIITVMEGGAVADLPVIDVAAA